MQLSQVPPRIALLALVVANVHAASFLAPHQASLVGQTLAHDRKEMPVTKHDKDAGSGYNKGSPLYKKQESMKDGTKPAATPEASSPVKGVEAPSVGVGGAQHDAFPEGIKQRLTNPFADGWKAFLVRSITTFLSYFIITMLIALIWVKCKGRNKRGYSERPNPGTDFAYSCYSLDHCFGHHANICLCTWCCTPLRIADTWSKEPFPLISSFWVALIMVTCLIALGDLTFVLSAWLLLGFGVYFRQQLRKQYGLKTGGTTCFFDYCIWFWCPYCAIAQEARQVEFVSKLGDTGSK